MKSIQIDTNAYAAFKRGDPVAVEIVGKADAIGLSVVVLGELLTGFRAGTRESENLRELSRFLDAPGVSIVEIDQSIAARYSIVANALRQIGKPIPTNDIWIAASALERGHSLFSYDMHFQVIADLRSGSRVDDFQ